MIENSTFNLGLESTWENEGDRVSIEVVGGAEELSRSLADYFQCTVSCLQEPVYLCE